MKHKYAYCLLATSVVAMVSSVPLAQASSIQIIPPSTSKFQVIGAKKKVLPKPMAKANPAKIEKVSEREMPAIAKTAMPQMRTGEAELPIVQVNETKSK